MGLYGFDYTQYIPSLKIPSVGLPGLPPLPLDWIDEVRGRSYRTDKMKLIFAERAKLIEYHSLRCKQNIEACPPISEVILELNRSYGLDEKFFQQI